MSEILTTALASLPATDIVRQRALLALAQTSAPEAAAVDTDQDFAAISWLVDRGVVRVAGEDAEEFLQAHLTNDMARTDDSLHLSAYCSAKGRVLALFSCWRNDNTYYLVCDDKTLLPPILKRWTLLAGMPRSSGAGLTAGIRKADIQIADLSETWAVMGVTGPQARQLAQEVGQIRDSSDAGGNLAMAGDEARWFLAGDPEAVAELLSRAGGRGISLTGLTEDAWRLHEIRAGMPSVVRETAEKFVPQMLNLQVLNGIDFTKGCYPGQEIVARMQYRGTLKRSMYRLTTEDASIRAGDLLQMGDSLDAGTVVSVARGIATDDNPPNGTLNGAGEVFELLAVLKRASAEAGGLLSKSDDEHAAALSVGSLPYALPEDAA